MSHIIQWNLAAEVERISSLKFPATQNFQICTVINCLNIMLLLFTIFRYLPNFIFSRSTAHLMTSQNNNVIWAEQFQIYLLLALTSFGMFVMKENYFFHFLSFFQKIPICLKIDPKNIASKNKTNYKFMFLVHIENFFQEIVKGATKLYFMYCFHVVIILFIPGLYKSAFSTCSLVNLVFRLLVF